MSLPAKTFRVGDLVRCDESLDRDVIQGIKARLGPEPYKVLETRTRVNKSAPQIGGAILTDVRLSDDTNGWSSVDWFVKV